VVRPEHKLAALGRILEVERPESAIVFCRTREAADELTEALGRRGFRPLALHGGMTQDQRDRVMHRFRAGAADLLVATDVAARGLDIPHLSHVVNFDLPGQPEAYVQRTGRVGRAGRAGVAITLVTPRERAGLWPIERATGRPVVIAPVPSAADLRAARLDRVRRALREELARPGSDEVAGLVAELETEFPAAAVARAARSTSRTCAASSSSLSEATKPTSNGCQTVSTTASRPCPPISRPASSIASLARSEPS